MYIYKSRYAFNGKETDNENGSQDYGMRIYKPELAKFLSVDPISKKYPELSPYQFAENQPLWAIDMDGLEKMIIHLTPVDEVGGTKIDVKKADFILYKVSITIDYPDGKVEQVELKKPLVIFINKSQTKGVDKLETGKTYQLAWQRMKHRWSTNKNTIYIFGSKSFIHPVATSGKIGKSGWLTGCKGIGFESDVKISSNQKDIFAKKEFIYNVDPTNGTKPIIHKDQMGAYSASAISSEQASKELSNVYEANKKKLQTKNNFELVVEPSSTSQSSGTPANNNGGKSIDTATHK